MEDLKMHNIIAIALLQGVTETTSGAVGATAANGRVWPLLTALNKFGQTAWLWSLVSWPEIIEEQKIVNEKLLTCSGTACNPSCPLIPLGSSGLVLHQQLGFMSTGDVYLIFAQLSAQP